MLLRKINMWGEKYYEIPEVTGPACPFMLFWKVNEHPLYKHESYFSWNKWPQQTDFHQQQPLSYWGLQCSNSLPCWYFRHRPHPHLHLLISFTPSLAPLIRSELPPLLSVSSFSAVPFYLVSREHGLPTVFLRTAEWFSKHGRAPCFCDDPESRDFQLPRLRGLCQEDSTLLLWLEKPPSRQGNSGWPVANKTCSRTEASLTDPSPFKPTSDSSQRASQNPSASTSVEEKPHRPTRSALLLPLPSLSLSPAGCPLCPLTSQALPTGGPVSLFAAWSALPSRVWSQPPSQCLPPPSLLSTDLVTFMTVIPLSTQLLWVCIPGTHDLCSRRTAMCAPCSLTPTTRTSQMYVGRITPIFLTVLHLTTAAE